MKHMNLILITLLIFSCGKNTNTTEASAEEISNELFISQEQFNVEGMQLETLTKQSFDEIIKVNGFIDVPPKNRASVSTFIDGYVTNTPLLVGDVVKKGQLLVTIQNPEFVELQQNYLEVKETLTYLKSEFDRQKTLYEENITSQKNFLKAESDYKSSLAHYNGLKQKLLMLNLNPKKIEKGEISSTINLYAPIQGSITKVNVSNGAYVSASSVIIEIVNTEHIHLELSVFEKDVLNVKKGQQIQFNVPEASKNTFNAEVYLVGNSIDERNRTIKVHGHIENEKEVLFVTGMFVEANIITNSSEALALPRTSIVEANGKYFALALKQQNKGYIFEQVEILAGSQSDSFIEVLNFDNFKSKQFLTKGAFMVLEASSE